MGDVKTNLEDSLDRIDKVCDRFENDWKAFMNRTPQSVDPARPCIEDFISGHRGKERRELFRSLLPLDLSYRGRIGEHPERAEYFERFRDQQEVVEEVFSGLIQCPTRMALPQACPTHIGGYEIRNELGRGAFGRVYAAWDAVLKREVVLKVPHEKRLQGNREKIIAHILDEGSKLAALDHISIVRVYAAVRDDTFGCALVMQHIPNRTLAELIQQRSDNPFTVPEAAQLIAKVAEAIEYAHSRRIIHQDLKPANILMDRDNAPHVGDFGLSLDRFRFPFDDAGAGGTPAYMSPEQWECGKIDEKADVWALGAILYELIAGRRPFDGASRAEIKKQVCESPKRLFCYSSEIGPDVVHLCQRCLDKSPDKRPTAGELAAELQRLAARGQANQTSRRASLHTIERLHVPAILLLYTNGLVSILALLCGVGALGAFAVGGGWDACDLAGFCFAAVLPLPALFLAGALKIVKRESYWCAVITSLSVTVAGIALVGYCLWDLSAIDDVAAPLMIGLGIVEAVIGARVFVIVRKPEVIGCFVSRRSWATRLIAVGGIISYGSGLLLRAFAPR